MNWLLFGLGLACLIASSGLFAWSVQKEHWYRMWLGLGLFAPAIVLLWLGVV